MRAHVPRDSNKTVLLRAGTHRPREPHKAIQLTRADSSLRIASYPGESAELSGAVPLTRCDWRLVRNTSDGRGVWAADLSDQAASFGHRVPGLRVNGSRAIRARYPNADPELGFGSQLQALAWLPPLVAPRARTTYKSAQSQREGAYPAGQFNC